MKQLDDLVADIRRTAGFRTLATLPRTQREEKASAALQIMVSGVSEVANQEQLARLGQLILQRQKELGPLVFQQEVVQRRLNLSDEQKADVDSIVACTRKDYLSSTATKSEAELNGIRLRGYEQVIASLTTEQENVWEEMVGPDGPKRSAKNLDFESNIERAGVPLHWSGRGPLRIDAVNPHEGKACCRVDGEDNFSTLMQCIDAEEFYGKRVIYRGFLRTADVSGGWAGLWMRVDRKGDNRFARGRPLQFDNMETRGVVGNNDWKEYQIVLDVPKEAHQICFGCLVVAQGTAWVDSLSFEIAGPEGSGPESTAMSFDDDTANTVDAGLKRAEKHLENDDLNAYCDECRKLLNAFGDTENDFEANLIAWAFALAPGHEQQHLQAATKLAERAVAGNPKDANALNTLGAVLYRSGRHAEAIETLETAVALKHGAGTVWDWTFLAMAERSAGNMKNAQAWLRKSVQWKVENRESLFDAPTFAIANEDTLQELQRFINEASELLEIQDAHPKP